VDSAVPLRGLSNTCSGSRQSGTSRQEIPDDALRLGRAATVDTTMCIDCGVLARCRCDCARRRRVSCLKLRGRRDFCHRGGDWWYDLADCWREDARTFFTNGVTDSCPVCGSVLVNHSISVSIDVTDTEDEFSTSASSSPHVSDEPVDQCACGFDRPSPARFFLTPDGRQLLLFFRLAKRKICITKTFFIKSV
jgi:hypothetical protein